MGNVFDNTAKAPLILQFFGQFMVDLDNSSGLNISITAGNAYGQVVAAASFTLADNAVNYIAISSAAALVARSPSLSAGDGALYKLTTLSGQIIDCNDLRETLPSVINTIRWQAAGIPTGALNGVNMDYTLPHVPVGSVAMLVNGVYQTASFTKVGAVYTWTGAALDAANGDTIEFMEYRY